MYNEEQKNRFLQDFAGGEKTQARARFLFNSIEAYEEQWSADICTRSTEELDDVLGKIAGVRGSTIFMNLWTLRRYAKWCMDHNIPGATDALLKIKEVGLEQIANTTVSGPEHLQNRLDLVFPPESDCKIYNVSRAFIWMAFFGIDEYDSINFTAKNVDLKNKVMTRDGRTYPIYDEAIPVLRNVCIADSFVYEHPRYQVIRARCEGSSILRGFRENEKGTHKSVMQMTSKRIKAAFAKLDDPVEMTYQQVSLSGIFYRVYLNEKETGEVDFTEVNDNLLRNKPNYSKEKRDKVLRDYKEDYIRWKAAFNL